YRVLRHARYDPQVKAEGGRSLIVFNVAYSHRREAWNQWVRLEPEPAARLFRFERLIARAKGINHLGDLFDGVDVGNTVLKFADDSHFPLHVTHRNDTHIQVARLSHNAVIWT